MSSTPALGFFARRLVSGVVTLLVASILIFLAVQALPGDVATNVLGRSASPELLAHIRSSLHLDDPLWTRYLRFIGDLVRGDLGYSTSAQVQGQQLTVSSMIAEPLRNTFALAAVTTVVFVPVCLLLGSLSALRAGRAADRVITSGALALGALPEFIIGTLLIMVLFTQLDLLPPVSSISAGDTPFTNPEVLVLPVLTLLAIGLGFGTRLLRASMLQTLDLDYVAMARLRGFSERRVIVRYVLRNALAPSVQVLAQMIQWLVGGIIVTESVFNYPGIGTQIVQAVTLRDVQVILVVATLLAAVYILINIIADFCVVMLVPKLRTRA